jgi:molecular chaperone GrpE
MTQSETRNDADPQEPKAEPQPGGLDEATLEAAVRALEGDRARLVAFVKERHAAAESARQERERLGREVAEQKERALRVAAELDNTRKRFQRELDQERRLARDKAARDWLDAVDSVDRALNFGGDDPKTWRQGVEGIHRQMLDVLKRQGVEPMPTTGERFNPHLHEALGAVPLPDKEPDTIAFTQRVGYRTLDGELVRAAQVIVVQSPDA